MKYLTSFVVLCFGALFLVSCQKGASGGANDAAMKADSAKMKAIENYKAVTEMFNTGKMDDLGKYIADNFIEHQQEPGQKPGLAGLKESMTQFRVGFPDLKFTVEHITADSTMIWAQVRMTGTNSGMFMGMPANNKKIDVEGVDIVRLENGKAVEHWGYYEDMKMMGQMGLMPPMGGGDKGGKKEMPKKK
jgi:steroid delta-isomerase-like uncharacterized protein